MSANQPQAYQLKSVNFQNTARNILLQNENGPCPLLAAANALLLRGVITLDPVCVRNGVASTDDVVNMLANRALVAGNRAKETGQMVPQGSATETTGSEGNNYISSSSHHAEYHLNEVLSLLPSLQHGMDVNPKFAAGPTGVEYTNNLAAFDLLGVELVHGWLLDPQDVETSSVVGNRTYNELIEIVIGGNEAREEVPKLEARIGEKEEMLSRCHYEGSGECAAGGEQQNDDLPSVHNSPQVMDQEAKSGDDNVESESRDVDEGSPQIVDQAANSGDDTTQSKNVDTAVGTEEGETSQSATIRDQISCGSKANDNSPVTSDQKEAQSEDESNSKQTPTPPSENDSIALEKEIIEMREKLSELSLQITRSEVANAFLTSSGHQLTYHGLEQLHNHLGNDTLCVFFRNNHFATITKHDGVLYLLVTDLGYANTPEIVWEKLDNIDGDTEHANEFFVKPKPREELKPGSGPTIAPELILAQRSQAESDYQLALAMSKGANANPDDEEGRLIQAAKELSLKTYHGDDGAVLNVDANNSSGIRSDGGASSQIDSDMQVAMAYQRAQEQSEHESEQLARQLQELEYARQRRPVERSTNRRQATRAAPKAASAASSCVIS